MSPSTKNRIENRIQEILIEGCSFTTVQALTNLLTSELSLAVKGLRESLEKERKGADDHAGDLFSSGRLAGVKKALSSFDSKAKEILGESS